MKFFNALILLCFTAVIMSCNIEVFPDETDLSGTWIEQTSQTDKMQLTFKENSTVFITKPYQATDTLEYYLDNSKEQIRFIIGDNYSTHQIELNKSTEELTIWNIKAGIPENSSVTVFEKI